MCRDHFTCFDVLGVGGDASTDTSGDEGRSYHRSNVYIKEVGDIARAKAVLSGSSVDAGSRWKVAAMLMD